MERIFLPLSVVVVLLVLLTGSGVYWANYYSVEQAKQHSTKALAIGTALSVSKQINQLRSIIAKMGRDAEVVDAMDSGDSERIRLVETRLESYLPVALKIRLLRPGVDDLDTEHVPHMGYADLDMVRETFKEDQPPAIQGDQDNRHLAITARIEADGRVVGVILASLSYDFVGNSIKSAAVEDQYLELKQGDLALASSGSKSLQVGAASVQLPVEQTSWFVSVWYRQGAGFEEFSLIGGIVSIAVLFVGLAFFVGYRKACDLLSHDQRSVLKAVKDLMTGNAYGNYPVNLSEMSVIISTLVQFKRVLDHQGDEVASLNQESESDFDGFFEESDFAIEEIIDKSENSRKPKPEPEPPSVAMPDFDWDTPSPTKPVVQEPPVVAKPPPVPQAESEFFAAKSKACPAEIFRAYDIRGIVGKTLTAELAYEIGRAFGTEAKNQDCQSVVVGRDGRHSSPELADSLINGIVSTGRDVLDLGMVPTPILYFVVQHTEGRTGIVVTGSHNPAEYNGMKMVVKGETLVGKRVEDLKLRIDRQDFAAEQSGTVDHNRMFVNEYIGIVAEDVHLVRPMKIVLDCGNGVTGEIAPVLFRTLGCEVIELFCEVDGSFPNHHPDPSKPENLKDLIAAVKHYQADVGIAFDGDGDRLGVVDSTGKIIWPDRLMMLFAKDVLARKPGAMIVYDVKCSRHLGEQIGKYGGRPLMWKTGHSYMKGKIKETGAKLAGEMSGHIFFNDRWYGFDDALYSGARLIEILSSDARTSAEVFAEFPDSLNTPELHIEMAEGENVRFVEKLRAQADFKDAKMTDLDGMRVDFTDGWGLIRASNTTPSLVIRFEADDESAMNRIQSEFKRVIQRIDAKLVLPF